MRINSRLKKSKYTISIIAVLFFINSSIYASELSPNDNYSSESLSESYIEVTGKASKELSPDKIYLNITLNEKDYKNTSLKDIEKKMISTLKSLGIDTKECLTVKDMASSFKSYIILKNDIKLMKQYQLLTTSAKEAAGVLIALDKIGISSINIDRVECSDIEKHKNDIRVEAMLEAKSKATLLTEAIGQSIGKAIYISENDYSPRPYNYTSGMMLTSKSLSQMDSIAEDVPDVEFEKIKIEITVLVRFIIE